VAAIYVGLRWHHYVDKVKGWSVGDLNGLFRAFFWRNALAGRYDQGLLSQFGADLKSITAILNLRSNEMSDSEWIKTAELGLREIIGEDLPNRERLIELATIENLSGAMQKAFELLLFTLPRRDMLEQGVELTYPNDSNGELHHIYPKAWFKDNTTEELTLQMGGTLGERIESVANMMLLARKSNNSWKTQVPKKVLEDSGLAYENSAEVFQGLFIDKACYDYLMEGPSKIKEFWDHRAELIADEIVRRATVSAN
jgi:hypothetical protein